MPETVNARPAHQSRPKQAAIHDFFATEKRRKVEIDENDLLLRIYDVYESTDVTTLKCALLKDERTILTVQLRDMWRDVTLRVGHTVRVLDAQKIEEEVFEVSTTTGRFVVEPFTLTTATTLAGTFWCERKAILQQRFRGAGTNKTLLLGCLVHEVFQELLRRRSPLPKSSAELRPLADDLLIKQFGAEFAALDWPVDEYESAIAPYLANVADWLREHAPPPVGSAKPLEFGQRIGQVHDIEQDFKSMRFGIRGRVDVSLRMSDGEVDAKGMPLLHPDVTPLELKTGKSAPSVEHRAQVTSYALVLSEFLNSGRITAGFVLYMKDNTLRRILPTEAELLGFMSMRNRVAQRLGALDIEELPPITRDAAFCAKCEYLPRCALMRRLAPPDANALPSDESRELFHSTTAHLRPAELEYARRWMRATFAEWRLHKAAVEKRYHQTLEAKNSVTNVESFYSFGLTMESIGTLMDGSEEAQSLRSLLIDLRKPHFRSPTSSAFDSLNGLFAGVPISVQQTVMKCLRAEDYALVRSADESVKFRTVTLLAKCLHKLGRTCLIVGPQSAVLDRLLTEMKSHLSRCHLLRVGAGQRPPADSPIAEFYLQCKVQKVAEMKALSIGQKRDNLHRQMFKTPIVLATASTVASSILFTRRRFDVCVCVDAHECAEPDLIRPMLSAASFVLIGDPAAAAKTDPAVLTDCTAKTEPNSHGDQPKPTKSGALKRSADALSTPKAPTHRSLMSRLEKAHRDAVCNPARLTEGSADHPIVLLD